MLKIFKLWYILFSVTYYLPLLKVQNIKNYIQYSTKMEYAIKDLRKQAQ